MTGREDRIRAEATALWREVFGEPAPSGVDGTEILDAIMRGLPELSYERMTSPHLRRSAMTWARPGG